MKKLIIIVLSSLLISCGSSGSSDSGTNAEISESVSSNENQNNNTLAANTISVSSSNNTDTAEITQTLATPEINAIATANNCINNINNNAVTITTGSVIYTNIETIQDISVNNSQESAAALIMGISDNTIADCASGSISGAQISDIISAINN